MWWLWPHFRRVWAATGTITAGLLVSYLYSLASRQPIPDERYVANFWIGYWTWIGAALVVFATVSIFAARAHRYHHAPHFLGKQPRHRAHSAAQPSPAPTSCASLVVGRTDELARMQDWFAAVQTGERRIVFVAGEAGIGKTTFVRSFLNSLSAHSQVRIARGQCVEQYGAGEPYMPVLSALTQLGDGAARPELLAILHQLAPAWLAQLPSLLTAEERVRFQGELKGVTQPRMLREMAQALEALAADTPLILVLEDLHWSDFSTLDLIGAIARRSDPAQLMILGAYRPVEMLSGDHPLRALRAELELHQQCAELRLKLLGESDVVTYLTQRFTNNHAVPVLSFPRAASKADSLTLANPLDGAAARGIPDSLAAIAATVYQRSDGNPLFMVNLVDDLVARGADFDASRIEPPRSLRQMIERNLERLTLDEQSVLEAASVAGAEFSAAAVAAALERPVAEIEACCAKLSRREQFVGQREPINWPDGTLATGFRFHHALYQETLYRRLPDGHRVEFHRRIAKREELGYGERTVEIAAELATHFRRANENDKAIKYFTVAGQQAIQRSAAADAIGNLTTAIELLETLSHDTNRDQRELSLRMMLAPALIATRGWGAIEMQGSCARAREICRTLGDPPELFSVLHMSFVVPFITARLDSAHQAAVELLAKAKAAHHREMMLLAHQSIGEVLFHTGQFGPARSHFDMAIALEDPSQPLSPTGIGTQVVNLAYQGWVLWWSGYPDQALKFADDAKVVADLSNPHTLAFADGYMSTIRMQRREPDEAAILAHRQMELCSKYGLADFLAGAHGVLGYALAAQGEPAGITELQQWVASSYQTGLKMVRPHELVHLAEACLRFHRFDDAVKVLDEAMQIADDDNDRYCEAETHRLRGELLLKQDTTNGSAARECFERAITVAQKQSAKSWELRATTSLARLLASQGDREQAHARLAPIYNWFTEGLDTRDLKEAKALLDELTS